MLRHLGIVKFTDTDLTEYSKMPSFSYNADGSIQLYARYSPHVPTLKYLFPTCKETSNMVKRVKGCKVERIDKHYNCRNNSDLVRKIIRRLLYKILTRVAEGDLFIFPSTTQASITLGKIPDEEVKMLRQMGKFKDINIVKTGFVIPRFEYDHGPGSRRRNKMIYVPKHIEQKSFRNAEEGKIPYTKLMKKKRQYDSEARRFTPGNLRRVRSDRAEGVKENM